MTALSRVHAYLAYGLLFAAIACAPACGGGSGSGSESSPAPTGGGIDARQRPSLAFPTGTATPMPVTPTRAFRNLSFSTPVFLTSALDTTDRIFVVEKGGRIKVFPNDPGAVAGDVTVFLDISSRVLNSGEMGLLGLAFPPGYATKQQFYVHYITDPGTGRTSRISRFTVPGATPNQADPSSEEVILEVAQPASNHNSGMLAFGPDGFLYVSFGDGGGSNDQFGNGQNVQTLLGSMLRIDPEGGTPYAIPPGNPTFPGAGARPELYAVGLPATSTSRWIPARSRRFRTRSIRASPTQPAPERTWRPIARSATSLGALRGSTWTCASAPRMPTPD